MYLPLASRITVWWHSIVTASDSVAREARSLDICEILSFHGCVLRSVFCVLPSSFCTCRMTLCLYRQCRGSWWRLSTLIRGHGRVSRKLTRRDCDQSRARGRLSNYTTNERNGVSRFVRPRSLCDEHIVLVHSLTENICVAFCQRTGTRAWTRALARIFFGHRERETATRAEARSHRHRHK